MRVNIEFDRPFYGMIFSKGIYVICGLVKFKNKLDILIGLFNELNNWEFHKTGTYFPLKVLGNIAAG